MKETNWQLIDGEWVRMQSPQPAPEPDRTCHPLFTSLIQRGVYFPVLGEERQHKQDKKAMKEYAFKIETVIYVKAANEEQAEGMIHQVAGDLMDAHKLDYVRDEDLDRDWVFDTNAVEVHDEDADDLYKLLRDNGWEFSDSSDGWYKKEKYQ